jgi:hypothetical protein
MLPHCRVLTQDRICFFRVVNKEFGRPLMAILDSIEWAKVRRHYDDRVRVSHNLQTLNERRSIGKFADLALGISDADGNYSAAEHGLGPKILSTNSNAAQRVFELADQFISLGDARRVPQLIRDAKIKYLQIGVGSEVSCMVNPDVCWVANTRTIWTHLVIKHADNVRRADEELKLYREADVSSEMAYQMWAEIHAELKVSLTRIAELGEQKSRTAKIQPGSVVYLWADAIASELPMERALPQRSSIFRNPICVTFSHSSVSRM